MGKKRIFELAYSARLAIKVTNSKGSPVKDAKVKVDGQEDKMTDQSGLADFGEITAGKHTISAEKFGYHPSSGSPYDTSIATGPSIKTTEVIPNVSQVVNLKLDPPPRILRENIIFVGSEVYYNSFATKMIFIASAFAMVDKNLTLRVADKTTVILVDYGYTDQEKNPLSDLMRLKGRKFETVKDLASIVGYVNKRPERQDGDVNEITLIQDMVYFCHGKPNKLLMNYSNSPDVNITINEIHKMKKDVFVRDGRIYSYACRTGVHETSEEFDSDDEALPNDSLAQKMADHFNVRVWAYLTRTDYSEVVRRSGDHERIAGILKKQRELHEGKSIDIPPEHIGFPHSKLSFFAYRAKKEGTDNYVLWRKAGAIALPSAAATPKGLSKTMRVFLPTIGHQID